MQILEKLKSITKEENIFINEPMSKHTTFRCGGMADYLVTPENKEEIKKLLELDIKKTVIGNGSNLLVKDNGIRGLVIQLTKNNSYETKGNYILAESGIFLAKLSQVAMQNDLSGLEFACGIPGTLGGAVIMNAGAYGGEIGKIIEEVEYINEDGKIETTSDCDFGYRKSIFQDKNIIVLSAKIKLENGNKEEIKNKMDEYMTARNQKQPINFPSAGSTFKRPLNNFAAKLIEDAGLKGYKIGGAEVSELHSGFIINTGNAKAKDVCDLIDYVQKVVKEKFDILLEPEIKIIGED